MVKNSLWIFLFICSLFVAGCFVRDKCDIGVNAEVKVISGTVYVEQPVAAAEDADQVPLRADMKTASGIRVYPAYSRDEHVYTDSYGRFSLTYDLVKYRQWKTDRGLDAVTAKIAALPVLAEDEVSGEMTSFTVPVSDESYYNLDTLKETCSLALFQLKSTCSLSGFVTHNLAPVPQAAFALLDSLTGEPVVASITDSTGRYSFISLPLGSYIPAIVKQGFRTHIMQETILDSIEAYTISHDLPDSFEGETSTFAVSNSYSPEISITSAGNLIASGSTVNTDADLTMEIDIIDQNYGLGKITFALDGVEVYSNTVSDIYNVNAEWPLADLAAGRHTFEITVMDYDMITSVSPATDAYVHAQVENDYSTVFQTSICIKAKNGNQDLTRVLTWDASKKGKYSASDLLKTGATITPYIHVNMGTHTVSGLSSEYDIEAGSIDPYNNSPVTKAEIQDNVLKLYFEEPRSTDPWFDYDRDDTVFELFFTESSSATSSKVDLVPTPYNTVSHTVIIQKN